MTRISQLLKDLRILSAIGLLLALAAICLLGTVFHLRLAWTGLLLVAAAACWCLCWALRRQRTLRAAGEMEHLFEHRAEDTPLAAPGGRNQDTDVLRRRLRDAVQTIKTSKIGQTTGRAALYELPWYIVIGNPAAGKSTAVLNSGLNFPFVESGGQAIQGVGGTRNCDWFFTTEGILLDTAGRYAVHQEDRSEWLGFLDLLKRHRARAPINGIVLVASIAELTGNRPDFTLTLAKQLRQRVQELTERLELFAPVYVVFTKVDLVAGFVDFFEDSDSEERSRVWGATLPYDRDAKADAAALFDQHFEQLADGLKELGMARMSLNREQQMSPGILTFPLEFVGIRHHLRTFIATLFEDNPFQFKPIFRGFYFTSAVQEGVASHATGQRILQQYGLSGGRKMTASISSNSGFFLRNLFSSVIFSDRHLVRQYASRRKLLLRQLAVTGASLALLMMLGGWTWSMVANRNYMSQVAADLGKAVDLQKTDYDLRSRLQALMVLQERLEQLQRYRAATPLALGFGLYQGERIENRLRSEYFKGLRQVMLDPVADNLERFLGQVNENADAIDTASRTPRPAGNVHAAAAEGGTPPARHPPHGGDVSPADPNDAYNALKTYLMLAEPAHGDPALLQDQLKRFWQGWLELHRGDAVPDDIARYADKLIAFYLSQAGQPDFPLIDVKPVLVDRTRETLRVALKGTPARERVYAEIRMRASARFPAMTVADVVGAGAKDLISGTVAVPGAFTRTAWQDYVRDAIRTASRQELQSDDWVLDTRMRDDLSLDGSPPQIERELVRMYKADYAHAWRRFIASIAIADFGDFDGAVDRMNRLGDPATSPLKRLVDVLYQQTCWDNPGVVGKAADAGRRGLLAWFREVVLRRAPAPAVAPLQQVDAVTPPASGDDGRFGVIGRQFAALARLAVKRGDGDHASLLDGYLERLSKIRSRFNQIKNAGDVGPPSKQLMQATLDGNGSELADGLRYVDEDMLAGMSDTEPNTVRPLLMRPLTQAFHVIVKPAEQELNRTWTAQVYDPFENSLANKYPFSQHAAIEATPAEIAQVFGPAGSIAQFVRTAMGPLVVRRGNSLSARTWADLGIRLNPAFTAQLARFVAVQGDASTAAAQPQTNFQLQPLPTAGLSEYTIQIDGQPLRYRNGRQDWADFSWPSRLGQPGATITALTDDGRSLQVVGYPGQFGLEKLINSARREKLSPGLFRMTWTGAGTSVSVNFRLISDARPGSNAQDGSRGGLQGLKLPAAVAGPAP